MHTGTTPLVLIAALSLILPSCGNEPTPPPGEVPACPTKPSAGVYATFQAGKEVFRVSITSENGIEQALALWEGRSKANIPTGNLVCEPIAWNCGWSWHLEPDSVRFAEAAIELCDGLPSHVEAGCTSFGGGSYCPWSAKLLELRDCRSDPTCPVRPR